MGPGATARVSIEYVIPRKLPVVWLSSLPSMAPAKLRTARVNAEGTLERSTRPGTGDTGRWACAR